MRMSDRKLMPMAAKAAGIRIEYEDDGSIAGYWNELGDVWEPLCDEADAFRLAVTMRADLTISQTAVKCVMAKIIGPPDDENDNTVVARAVINYEDESIPQKEAVMLALVRAAAEIGEKEESA